MFSFAGSVNRQSCLKNYVELCITMHQLLHQKWPKKVQWMKYEWCSDSSALCIKVIWQNSSVCWKPELTQIQRIVKEILWCILLLKMDFTIWWKFYLLTVSTFKYLIQLLYFFYEKYVLMYNLFFVKMKLHCVQFEHQNRSYFALSFIAIFDFRCIRHQSRRSKWTDAINASRYFRRGRDHPSFGAGR